VNLRDQDLRGVGGDVCGTVSDLNFGTPAPSIRYDPALLGGWAVRPGDWQVGASVQQAVTFLGLAEVFGIVTGACLRRSFVSNDPMMEQIWDESAARGASMRRLASELHVLAPDRAYTCGLFENAGMALLLVHAPGYAHTASQAGDGMALMERERVRYGVDHPTLGQALMRTWGLPEELALAVRQHHGLAQLDDAEMPLLARQLVALSTMANAALSDERADWESNRALIAHIVEAAEEQLQRLFDELATLDPMRN